MRPAWAFTTNAAIFWFTGPHEIYGYDDVGTFKFLHEHLDWPPGSSPQAPAQ